MSYAAFLQSKQRRYAGDGLTGSVTLPAPLYADFLALKRERIARRVYIYALLDPIDDEIRYVGKSIQPKERLQNHCAEKSVTWRTNWIRAVMARGHRPRLRILEILDRDDNWQQAERDWIARLRDEGARLTNCTSGGDGVPDLPSDIRARISAVWKGRKHSPETLAKLRAVRRTQRHTDESRAKMRAAMTGRVVTWGDKLRHAIEKLSADDVRAIRVALAAGETHTAIGARYGVDKGTISNIKRGVCYRWVR